LIHRSIALFGIALALPAAMPVQDPRQSLGKLGESLACDELRRRGYSILATRHRTRFGEIDIVAERSRPRPGARAASPETAFVEVKARRSTARGSAAESVSARKRRRISAMALDYLAYAGRLDSPCGFVVVAIDSIGTPKMTIRVIEDAWTVDEAY
jgi:putative endonuclease